MARPSASPGTGVLGRAAYGGPKFGSADGGGAILKYEKPNRGTLLGDGGRGSLAGREAGISKKKFAKIFSASLRGRVDHLIAVVERVEIAKGINLDVRSLRERL